MGPALCRRRQEQPRHPPSDTLADRQTHTITLQQYSTPHCALGSEAANPFAPTEDGDTDPQTLSVAFGVCFKDPRVGNINDNPDTKFDETKVYNYLPQYMKMVCNP